MSDQIESTINEIFGLYEQYGSREYAGEKVSQLEHMSQAGLLALGGGAAGTQSLRTISQPLRPAAVDICSPN